MTRDDPDRTHDELPLATPELPGCGGELKSSPEHFVVEEVPLYAPSGAGEHVYVALTREGWSTRDLAVRLARIADVQERDVGYAGLKDKVARATQTFSIPWRGEPAELARRVADELGVVVHSAVRHGNKLRRGHLVGNRFDIVVAGTVPDALARARAIGERLLVTGFPNVYGEQRLGAHGEHARRGARDLAAPRKTFASRFALNALQAELFNRVVARRVERGWFERVLVGDVAKKLSNGALFDVLDEAVEAPRASAREIVATGPMFGGRMKSAQGEPGALEAEVLAESGIEAEAFGRAKLDGTRRAVRAFVANLEVAEHPLGLRVAFQLPKGSYATVVLREFTKGAGELAELDED